MEQILMENQWVIWLMLLWAIPWKGLALWKAARNSHKKWFVALFLVNTMAILEIIYIFYFSKERKVASEEPKNILKKGKRNK